MPLDIFSLLTLSPDTSKAFSVYKSTNPVQVPATESGSASPVRKVARLDSDSDSASASRSRSSAGASGGEVAMERGILQVKITGPSCEFIHSLPLVFRGFG